MRYAVWDVKVWYVFLRVFYVRHEYEYAYSFRTFFVLLFFHFFILWQFGTFAQWSLVVLITSVTPSSPETFPPPDNPAPQHTHNLLCPVTHWVIRFAAWALPGIIYWSMGNFWVATPLKKPLRANSPSWAAPHLWQNVYEPSLVKPGTDSHGCNKFTGAMVLLHPAGVFLCTCPNAMPWLFPSSLWF